MLGLIMLGWFWVGAMSAKADTLTIQLETNGLIQLTLQGSPNQDYQFQASTNLVADSWWVLAVGTSDASGILTESDSMVGFPAKYYRTMLLPPVIGHVTPAQPLSPNAGIGSKPALPHSAGLRGATLPAVINQRPASLKLVPPTPRK